MVEVRCFSFLEPENHQVVSICIDLNLAAQSVSWAASKEKLQNQIKSYMDEIYLDDPLNKLGLFPRPAPFELKLKYWLGRLGIRHCRFWSEWVYEPGPYVVFSSSGVHVDLPRFFKSREGQKRLAAIKAEGDRLFKK